MSDKKYTYLFPFERVPPNSNVLIYGAGLVGQEYLKQIQMTHYCKVVGFIDRAWHIYRSLIVPVYAVEQLKLLSYDYIVLAFQRMLMAEAVRTYLIADGEEKDKIIYIAPRVEPAIFLVDKNTSYVKKKPWAYEVGKLSIAVRLGPALGDNIIKKKFVEELIRIAPEAAIDIYSIMSSLDLYAIYGCEANINVIVDDGGELYQKNLGKYSLSISVFAILKIDFMNYQKILVQNSTFANKLKQLQEKCLQYGIDENTLGYIHVMRQVYQKHNYYTAYNYDGVFDIHNHKIRLELNKGWQDSFKKLTLTQYITINYGNGISMVHEKIIAKQWPYGYFQKLVLMIKKQYPHIQIVQLGAKHAQSIEHVDRYVLGESLELVKYILKNAMFHFDIDGGLVHLATALGTKCVVLFGPTSVDFLGYEENLNIVSQTCSGCYSLYENASQCARGMEQPECMYSIKPEYVFGQIQCLLADAL